MTTGILLSDIADRIIRLATLEATGLPVVRIVPDHFPKTPNALYITTPPNWLPRKGDEKHKGWRKSETIYLAAYQQLAEKWNYVWCIESDVRASLTVWNTLFEKTACLTDDLIGAKLKTRESVPNWYWFKKSALRWAGYGCLGCIYRLSRRSVEWLIEDAVKNREIYGEVIVPSVIAKRGGTLREIRDIYDCYDFYSLNWRAGPEPDGTRLYHPVKTCSADE